MAGDYDELKSLMASSDPSISKLALVIQNMRERLESVEKRQTELLEEINDLRKN